MDGQFVPSPHEDKAQDRQSGNARENAAKRPRKRKGSKQNNSVDSKIAAPKKRPSKNKTTQQKSAQNPRGAKAKTSAYGRNTAGKKRGRTANAKERRWIGRTAYGALDLGTNNCRLLIAREAADGFTVIDAFSRVVRLGEGLSSSGRMSEEAMDRAVEALSICSAKLKRRNVALCRSVATEACRQAGNGREFIERVANETGIILDIIEPREEARLAVMGCYALLEEGDGPALIFDIGGGSTELVLINAAGGVPEILDWVSAPWGVVSLTESLPGDQSTQEGRLENYNKMRETVAQGFAEFADRLPKKSGTLRLMGTSGTVTTLSSVYLDLPHYNRNMVDGLYVPTSDMRKIAQEIAGCNAQQRAEYPTIGQDRADLVVAGCAIMEAIFDIWPGERLGVADRGIREGILRALISSDQRRKRGSGG